ncbi:Gar1/Naf1 RNA binding region-domain-containing protein [Flagelloscypha sp. PMI_526]|nr:Gar1/Naf1 RNA binding region-domain-containing protein [Flagelloscypha sp. PMI_526]
MDTLAQDLQLIQDLVGISGSVVKAEDVGLVPKQEEENIDSSSSETESTISSSSESDSSDSEPEFSQKVKPQLAEAPNDELEDEGPLDVNSSGSPHVGTRNEVSEPQITIPDIESVGSEEFLELVGEISSIVNNSVVVRVTAPTFSRERVLDNDTLLVFEDRTVFGYIADTFGPTSQPFYQVRFSKEYPLDPKKVQYSRQVFHVPERSRFVEVNQIRRFKGSDASNLHDEEVGEEEIDFSDDEAEAAYRRSLKQRRRGGSVTSSRFGTPALSEGSPLPGYSGSAWDEHSPYDMDYEVGPSSRPTPLPYDDDPYAEPMVKEHAPILGPSQDASTAFTRPMKPLRGRGRGRGLGRGRGRGGFQDSVPRRNVSSPATGSGPFYPLPELPFAQPFPSMGPPLLPPTMLAQMGPPMNNPAMAHAHINPRFAAQFGFPVPPGAYDFQPFGPGPPAQGGSWPYSSDGSYSRSHPPA